MDNQIISFLLQLQSKRYLTDGLVEDLNVIVDKFDLNNTFQGYAEYWKRVFNSKRRIVVSTLADTDTNYSIYKDDTLCIELSKNREDGEHFIAQEILMDLLNADADMRTLLSKIAYRLVENKNTVKNTKSFLKNLLSKTDRSIHGEIYEILDDLKV